MLWQLAKRVFCESDKWFLELQYWKEGERRRREEQKKERDVERTENRGRERDAERREIETESERKEEERIVCAYVKIHSNPSTTCALMS